MTTLLHIIDGLRGQSAQAGVLMLALLLPCAAPSLSESVLLSPEEVETEWEDTKECTANARVRRFHRLRQAALHLAADNRANCSVPVGHHRTGHLVYAGHRMENGLLAPLTC